MQDSSPHRHRDRTRPISPTMGLSAPRISRMSEATTTTATLRVPSMRASAIVRRTRIRTPGRGFPIGSETPATPRPGSRRRWAQTGGVSPRLTKPFYIFFHSPNLQNTTYSAGGIVYCDIASATWNRLLVHRSPTMGMSTPRISRMSEATTTTATMQVPSMRTSTIVRRTRIRTPGRGYPVSRSKFFH